MDTKREYEHQSQVKLHQRKVGGAIALLLLLPVAAWAGGVVTNCTEAALRAAMAGGGVVTFACDGTITLGDAIVIGANTELDGTGHQVTISGGGSMRVFYVNTNISFTAINLTIADGAIRDYPALGGAIYNSGTVMLDLCTLTNNSATSTYPPPGSSSSGDAAGGAILNEGTLTVHRTTLCGNTASGGTGYGGHPRPGDGGFGCEAKGAAICNLGNMLAERSLFVSNTIVGGAGGGGQSGGSGTVRYPPYPSGGGMGGTGGDACGGALFVGGPSSLVNCTLTGNQARGGPGGAGGNSGIIDDAETGTWWYVVGGGSGGSGGAACGAVYDATGALRLTNCTIAFNSSEGGSGAVGGVGGPNGLAATSGTNGMAVGGLQTTNGILANCLLAGNSPANGTSGLDDAGHNLSSDASCAFTSIGSLNNTDPKLGPLANNGGPTLTLALLPGSPAIDAGDTSAAPDTDQRGFPRPAGSAADIGAFEYGTCVAATLAATTVTINSATLDGSVNPSGSPTTAWFQWGATTNYGNLTPVIALGNGTTALPLSAPLAGLSPAVTYHFRVAATNSPYVVYGSDQSFTTLGPPLVSTLPATDVTANNATLNGTVSPNGWPTAAWFRWGATTNYGNLTSMTDLDSGTNALPLSVPLGGLTPNVTYHFCIAATNDYGPAYGSDQLFTTLWPPQVLTLPVTGLSTNSATLNATVNPDGWPTTAWFQWGATTNYGNLTSVTGLGSGTIALPFFALLVGLTPGVTYHFRIAATNDYGLVYGSDQSFSTLAWPLGSAQTYTVLKNFTGSDGQQPEGGLVLSDTTLYGTASAGGSLGVGVVFKMNTTGSGFTVLKNFAGSDGAYPVADLLLSGNTLYGTTDMGGNYDGVVFKVNTDGSGYTVIKNFTLDDGFALWGGLALSDNTLYGTTFEGGGWGGSGGVVFKVNTDGSGYTGLKRFTGSDGGNPRCTLVLSGSTLYGTAANVFKVNTDGSGYMVLKNFTGSDGYNPFAGLVLSGSTLYGTTGAGGSSYSSTNQGYGVVFKMNTDGSGYTVLKNFTGSDGCCPMADLVLSGSTLYGTTEYGGSAYNPPNNNGYGVVFMLNTDGSGYTVLKSFTGSDGWLPSARLVLAGSTLFGTTQSGGSSYSATNAGYGVVFALSLPFPAIARPTCSQTAEAGSTAQFTVSATGSPPPAYQWYFDGTNAIGCTNACLELTNVQFSQSGAYTVVITNVAGAVTSAPAMLNVIAAVEHRPVPGVKVTGEAASLVNVDCADALSPAPTWTPLGSVSLTGTPQYCCDPTLPLPSQRFYRAWQTGTPGVRPSLDLHPVPAITLTGTIGHSVRLDYINQFGPTDAWVTLDTVMLTNTSQLYFDISPPGQPPRLYRLVPSP